MKYIFLDDVKHATRKRRAERLELMLSPGWWFQNAPGEPWERIRGLGRWLARRNLTEGQRIVRVD